MLFSSISFLYYFLPIILLIYFIVPSKWKNFVLLVFSLFFYFYGEPNYIWVLLFSCLFNYLIGKEIGKHLKGKYANLLLIFSVLVNLGFLFYFKYTDFFIGNWNQLTNMNVSLLHIVMPIGISFFTFQTLSYVIDVWRGKVPYNKSLLSFATYVCLFPQLVAGPIVRYETIHEELKKRDTNMEGFAKGLKRFIIGLAKKVLLANLLGELCKQLSMMAEQTVLSSWLQAIGFSLQIYFDFSGYSDMAIGLGLFFGFHFLENFNYPFIARSITDFWRRWHISLSSWLKDYVYIPLGGSRTTKYKWIRNIIIVWFLTGFWHGAAWNFILWGLYFVVLLLIEKKWLNIFLEKHHILSHIYTLFFVTISFVIFNAGNLNEIGIMLQNMFGIFKIPLFNLETLYYGRSYLILLILGVIGATPMYHVVMEKWNLKKYKSLIEPIYLFFLFILCTAYLIDASFNPFLYFRF